MDIFIYFFEQISYGLDEIEDALNEAFGTKGEVTGSGTGESGSNIDIEIISEDITKSSALVIVRKALSEFDLPLSTIVEVDGEEYRL
jgi:hypothetical protein